MIQTSPYLKYLGSMKKYPKSIERLLTLVILVLVLGSSIFNSFESYILEYISYGFSAPYSADLLLNEEKYIGNYPSGSELISKTATILPYLLMNKLQMPWKSQIFIMISAEYCSLLLCIMGMFYQLKQHTDIRGKVNITIISLIFLLIISLTNIRSQNLGFWAMPYFNGQNYNFSDALRFWALMGIALNNSKARYTIALIASFLFHPTLGALAIATSLIILLIKKRYYELLKLLISAVIVMILWYLLISGHDISNK